MLIWESLMERHLNLVASEFVEVEKRVLPRFPFSYLMFKSESTTFEVNDISWTGMQLSLKNGEITYQQGDSVKGTLQWRGILLDISGIVKWVHNRRMGIEFKQSAAFTKKINHFLSTENIISGMKSLHDRDLDMDLPTNLKYWLRADGPVEIFMWQHMDGELARFQIILMKNFIEWEDGKGIKTGSIINNRNIDTPLVNENEFVFQVDGKIDGDKIAFARNIVQSLSESHLPEEARNFLRRKLGV